jgi:hypothetical protein
MASDDYHEHLRNLLNDDHKTGTTHIHDIFKSIIPEKITYQSPIQGLLSEYFMILLGHFTKIYESDGITLALKGGRSIQLLVDGAYKSDDMDIKIISTPEGKTKQEVAEEVANRLVSGLLPVDYPLSIQTPNPKRPHTEGIYKISVMTSTGFKALVDVDYRELECVEPTSIQCRLKNILSELVTIQIGDLYYNTYSVETQRTEKEELIKEYKGTLRQGLIDALKGIDPVNDKQFIDELQKTFEKMKPETGYLGGIPVSIIKQINEFFEKHSKYRHYEGMIMEHISKVGLGDVFLLNKFERSLKDLKRGSRKERELKAHLIHRKRILTHAHRRLGKSMRAFKTRKNEEKASAHHKQLLETRAKRMLSQSMSAFKSRKNEEKAKTRKNIETANQHYQQLAEKRAKRMLAKSMRRFGDEERFYNAETYFNATPNSEPLSQEELLERLSRVSRTRNPPPTQEQIQTVLKSASRWKQNQFERGQQEKKQKRLEAEREARRARQPPQQQSARRSGRH